MMEGERKRSKGGFFHLFEWNGKSRKKLLTNNSKVPERLNQEKENVNNTARSGFHSIDADDRRANSSNNGSVDFSCASSVTSDDGNDSRAPGVVARLMGLESLPTSNVIESSPASYSGFSLLQGSQSDTSTSNLWGQYNPMDHDNISNQQDRYSSNSGEPRLHKVQNRPIERFQKESLPPKSAKVIPITHHKLLSPIKSPGFIPKKKAAYIMETAAKIIEASPKATSNGKVPSIGSSSVPLRIRDLKQKIEAAHTASRPPMSKGVVKNVKGQLVNKSEHKLEGSAPYSASTSSAKGISSSPGNKGKSVSPTVPTKFNAKGGRSMPRNNNSLKQKEQNEVKSLKIKSQPITQRTVQKGNAEKKTNNVLRQNNQKQNGLATTYCSTSKTPVSNQQGGKAQSTSDSIRPSRMINKVIMKPETTSRKISLVATDSEKEKRNNTSQRKQSVNGDLRIKRNVSDGVSSGNKYVKCNGTIDGCRNLSKDNRKSGMDVVSFTFTSPMTRIAPNSQHSGQIVEENTCAAIDSFGNDDHSLLKNLTAMLPGLNIIDRDNVGVLLEQKLRDLTRKVESPHCNVIRDKNSTGSMFTSHNSAPTPNVVTTTSAAQERRFQQNCRDYFECFILEDSQITGKEKGQILEETDEPGSQSNIRITENEFKLHHPIPASSIETSRSGLYSSFSGTKQCSPAHDLEMFDWISRHYLVEMEEELELSDSASSISVDVGRKLVTTASTNAFFKHSSNWELDYVSGVLQNAELLIQDFVLGQIPTMITPNLFNQLEKQEDEMEEYCKLERKVVFDCICEYLDFTGGQAFIGSCKAWGKLCTLLFRRKGWLAEELHKEIVGWKSMGDLMVDELVDKDMSTKYGRWLDFEMEALEEGMEIEKLILTSLVDEAISDLLLL